jgi:hypothetical protein
VLLVERSFSRAWHVMNHRFLFVWSLKHNSLGQHIRFWVIFCPINWLVLSALLLRLFSPEPLVQNVDLFQIVLAYLLL